MKLSSNNLLKLAFAFLVTGLIGFFTACTGPAGPTGTNGTATCQKCHGQNDFVQSKFFQYDLSVHNTGTIYEEEAGRLQCGGCHTGDGFVEAVNTGKDDPTTKASAKISCITCHDIHDKFDTTDFKLRITDGFKLRQFGTSDGMVDFKKGNICAKCHQARPYSHDKSGWDTLKPAETGASYSRFGPHYGVIANVLSMKGIEDGFTGPESLPTSNPHSTLAKGCVSCHMGSDATNPAVGGHTFNMPKANIANVVKNDATCQGCHSADKVAAAAVQTQVKADLAVIRQKFLDLNMLDISQTKAEDGSYNVLGEYAASSLAKPYPVFKADDKKWQAFIVYLFLAKDRSNGAHNPDYVIAQIKNIKAALDIK